MKTLSIIGSCGMVGSKLVSYFKEKGFQVFTYDKNNEGSIEEINKGDIIFICVPTPTNENGCDTSIVDEVVGYLEGEKIVVIKSTVLPGTTEKLQKKYPQHKILFNPEFLTEKTAEQDFRFPDRQIIGYTKKSYNVASDILRILPLAPFERIIKATEVETTKYFNNNWFAVKVIFANQFFDLCNKLGVDYDVVKECASADRRMTGTSHLEIMHDGYRGFGGACIPKDLKATIKFADDIEVDMELLKVVDKINKGLYENKNN